MAKGDTFTSEEQDAIDAGFVDGQEDNFADMFDENGDATEQDGEPAESDYDDSSFADDDPEYQQAADAHSQGGNESGEAQNVADIAAEDHPLGDDDGAGDADQGQAAKEPVWPDELVRSSGLTLDRAKEVYGDPETLADEMRKFDSNLINRLESPMQQSQPASADTEVPGEDQEFNIDSIIPEEWEDGVKDTFRQLNSRFDAEMKKRDERLEAQEQVLVAERQRQQAADNQRYVADFEQFIDDLGDDWAPTFGAGTHHNLPEKSMAFRNRVLLDETANKLGRNLADVGMPVPDATELRLRAMQSLFPQKMAQAVEDQTVKKVEGRRKQFTNRPTGRRSSAISGEQRAIRRAQELFDKKNMGNILDDDDITEI